MLEAEYNVEENLQRKAIRGLGLAKNLLEVGRQHQVIDQDAAEAISHYLRAMKLYEDAIAIRETEDTQQAKKALTYARFALSEVCSSLGVAYNDAGQVDQALKMHQRALEIRKAIVGKDHPSVAECLNNLGGLFFARGSLQKAAEHFEQALDMLTESAEGRQDTPYAALTLYNLGLCRAGLMQMPAAATALERALQVAERSLGSDHRQVDLIQSTIAAIAQGSFVGSKAPTRAGENSSTDSTQEQSSENEGKKL